MKMSFFIDRPTFSAVLSILIVVVGCIGLFLLPVDQYPQITPPMVKISGLLSGGECPNGFAGGATPIEQGAERNTGNAVYGIEQF